MLKIKSHLQAYPQRGTGIIIFRHVLEGTPEAIADYKAKQGANYREENGEPLFFSRAKQAVGTELHLSYDKTRYQAHSDLEHVAKVQEDKVQTLRALMAVTGYSKEDMVKVALGGVASVK